MSEYHDARIILPNAVYAAGNNPVTVAKDHHAGFYLMVDITTHNGGTVIPRMRLKSQAPAANSKLLWTAAVSLSGSNQTVCYVFYPQGLENLAPVVGLGFAERVALPMPKQIDLEFVVSVASVTFSAEIFGLAL